MSTRPRKFTALLDGDSDARYGRLLERFRQELGPIATRDAGNGHIRTGYDLSRADLLRGLLVAAENDPAVMRAVEEHTREHYGAPSSL